MEVLIKAGCDVIARGGSAQCMAHHLAALNGHPECLEVLIKAGCDLMAKAGWYTALDLAKIHKKADCVALLLRVGCRR